MQENNTRGDEKEAKQKTIKHLDEHSKYKFSDIDLYSSDMPGIRRLGYRDE